MPWTRLSHETIDLATRTSGWFCGYNAEAGGWALYRSTDGGSSWSRQRFVADISSNEYGPSEMQLAALSDRCCFAYDDRRVLRTVDGGRHWQRMYVTPNENTHISRGCFVSPSVGFCSVWTPSRGYVKRTSNGGRSWVTIAQGSASYGDLGFVDSQHGWVVRADRVLRTANGGRTWQRCGRTKSSYIGWVSFATRTTGWIAGIWGVEKTTDGGRTWSVKLSSWWNGGSGLLVQSPSIAWASGIGGERSAVRACSVSPASSARAQAHGMPCLPTSDWPPSMYWPLARTTDGGASWTRISLPDAHYFDTVRARCWVLCRPENGDTYIMRSDDRGDSWTRL